MRSFPAAVDVSLFNTTFQKFAPPTRKQANPDRASSRLSLPQIIADPSTLLLLTPSSALGYGASFAALTCSLVSSILDNWTGILNSYRSNRCGATTSPRDTRNSIPSQWSLGLLLISLIVSYGPRFSSNSVLVLPPEHLLLAVGLAAVFVVPAGVIA